MDLEHVFNDLDQPVGISLEPAALDLVAPPRTVLAGRLCDVVPLDATQHGQDLFTRYLAADDDGDWTYLPYGPFAELDTFLALIGPWETSADPLFHAIVDKASGRAVGIASWLRVNPAAASIEVGHIHFSRDLQGTPGATEAMYLMMRQAFGLGYRRYEWKCDALNQPSRAAAGIFRQATHYKGRNRDTAWYSIIDAEWPAIRARFERWLSPENFDENGRQCTRLNGGAASDC